MAAKTIGCVGIAAGTAVVLTGTGTSPAVADRRKITTRDGQPYHDAVDLDLDAAETLIAREFDAAVKRATDDLRDMLSSLKSANVSVERAGVVWREYRLPSSLGSILRSHPLCHAAEGQMTREAAAAACEACGLEVTMIPDGDIDLDGAPIDLVALGKAAGPPWRKEHKQAAVAAWLASR